mmetsp:Transcript_21767/g.49224  ORF Transcript_21767/g.49224 Transcript_21767/m.49224 type:complete len:546 (-) Transcript_21767:288-1925(-)|eukprot:CAMPEP_0172617448 /NCGR_PEP_ID=MMETSP1068-20121228/70260_1 /TAXON_ID=35684 /ORGANISM="Pseudopedinella elastica, Strain CCMP716" /LENGTH=545 /DNA_ID=CAMNT_0013423211 /DNA_START=180 /DNA_END=1817 /DNA_ORIENTATION=+
MAKYFDTVTFLLIISSGHAFAGSRIKTSSISTRLASIAPFKFGLEENLQATKGLQPEPLYRHFAAISAIPRASTNEAAVLEYLKEFAEARGFEHASDSVGNLVIRRPSRFGSSTVLVQGHVDMVTEKHTSSPHDFLKDPIRLRQIKNSEGTWLAATDTTLGADNGIGVAAALALLEEPEDAELPPLECLFTVDEETGLTGAQALDVKALGLEATTMLNLDTEEWGTLYFGCAGGGKSTMDLPLDREAAPPPGWRAMELVVSGLMGGHSGINIHEDRGNAIKILVRVLDELSGLSARAASLQGGDKHNAIPREASAVVWFPPGASKAAVEAAVSGARSFLREEFANEAGLAIEVRECVRAPAPYSAEAHERLLQLLQVLPSGVIKYSHVCPGLVETSTNIASVKLTASGAQVVSSTRSSFKEALEATRRSIASAAKLSGASCEADEAYPGWAPNPASPIISTSKRLLGLMLPGGEGGVEVIAIHAGLECGLLAEKVNSARGGKLDIVSFGPTIKGAHSPDERLLLDTVPPFWDLVKGVLRDIALAK